LFGVAKTNNEMMSLSIAFSEHFMFGSIQCIQCIHLHDVHCCLCLQALVAVSSISDCNVCLCIHLNDVHRYLCLQALSHKTLVTLLEVDPAKKPGIPLPTSQPSITYAYLKHKWHVSRQRVSQQVCASRFCFSLPRYMSVLQSASRSVFLFFSSLSHCYAVFCCQHGSGQ